MAGSAETSEGYYIDMKGVSPDISLDFCYQMLGTHEHVRLRLCVHELLLL